MAAEKKIPFGVLEMLVFMVDHPGYSIRHSSGFGSDTGSNFWVYNGFASKTDAKAPSVSDTTRNRAVKEEWLVRDTTTTRSGRYNITDAGKVVAESNRDIVHPPIKRYLITKRSTDWGNRDAVCGTLFGALCEVVKSSDKRHYVRMIDTPTGAAKRLGLCEVRGNYDESDYHCCVQGTGATKYIDVNNVFLVDTSVAAYDALVRAYFDHTTSRNNMSKQEQEEITDLIKPIKDRYEQRRAQRYAQLQIELNEITGKKV